MTVFLLEIRDEKLRSFGVLGKVSSFLILVYPGTLADPSQSQSISNAVDVIVGAVVLHQIKVLLVFVLSDLRGSASSCVDFCKAESKPPYPVPWDCRTESDARDPYNDLILRLATIVSILFYFELMSDNA